MLRPRHCAALLLISLAGCPDGDDQDAPPDQRIWAETTVPYDPTCESGCIELDRREMTHNRDVMVILANPEVDDPVAQWGRCLDDFLVCLEAGGEVAGCVDASICPAPCKRAFTQAADGATARGDQLAAFESVFIDDGALCRPDRVDA